MQTGYPRIAAVPGPAAPCHDPESPAGPSLELGPRASADRVAMTYDDTTRRDNPEGGITEGPPDSTGTLPLGDGAIDEPGLGAPDPDADPRGVGPDGSIDGGGSINGGIGSSVIPTP